MAIAWTRRLTFLTGALVLAGAMTLLGQQPGAPGAVAVDADDIGGVVRGPAGPEAGVWVIAETADLPTTFRKIVVTDDQGRYVVPDLPKASYRVWVRGYGLVDSDKVQAAPGRTLALTAKAAPDPRAAAHYFPGNYWLSLLQIPAATEFPMVVPAGAPARGAIAPAGAAPGAPPAVGGAPAPSAQPTTLANQGEFIHALKRGCQACHQMGNQATREIPKNLGVFDSSVAAWERRLRSGQTGAGMLNAVHQLGGRQRGLAMFADWTDRISAGEVPPTPPRPQGAERNVVISVWDYGTDRAFVHDIIASNKRNPTQNAYGPIYGPDWSAGALAILDPAKHTKSMVTVPIRNEADRARMRTWSPQQVEAPSPYWGEEIVWTDPVNPNQPHLDNEGRVWFNTQTRADQAAFCRTGSSNPFARNFPLDNPAKGLANYDPKTGRFELIDMCFSGQHGIFANDRDETMYFSMPVGVGWFNTRIWDETHDAEKAQGWCPAIVNGQLVANANGYGVATSFKDGSAWYVAGVIGPSRGAVPGKILRVDKGSNPPATCRVEVYEPPFGAGVADQGYFPQGVDVDTNGIVWTALAGSNHLASFDRSKCKVLSGPTATGQHCREGWTLHPVAGPSFKGSTVRADFYYYNQVDLHGALGLGPNTPIINGTGSDSLIAFDRTRNQFVRMVVPYPMGFYTRGVDARIDNPNIGWKGRGLWAANNNRVVWHTEGGKGQSSYVAQFQIRPDPLAK